MKKISNFINSHKFYFLLFFALFSVIYLLYGQTPGFSFVYLDDNSLIVNRTDEMDSIFKIKNFIFKPVFEGNMNRFYRPVLNLSIFLDTFICGGEPGFYHFSNMLIHVAAVFLLFLFLKELGYSFAASSAAALLFAVHPALTPAVAWIPGRNDSLLAVFLLFSFIFFIKNLKTKKIRYLLLFTAFFTVSLFTKETAVIAPFLFFAYVVLYDKRNGLDKKTVALISAAVIVPILIYMLSRSFALAQNTSDTGITETAAKLILSAGASVWYFGIMFLTDKIILFPQLKLHAADLVKGLIPLISLAFLCVFFRRKINLKHILFGAIWFLLFIFPTYAVASGIYHTHRLYIPMIGILIILTELASVIDKTYPSAKKLFYPALAVLIIFMSLTAHKQSFFYKDRQTFWFQAYKENPSSPIANAGVSKYYSSINDFENALKYMQQALDAQKNKDSSPLISQIALIYFNKGDLEKSKDLYEKALSSGSKYDESAYIGLSKAYQGLKDNENALKTINKGLSVMPDNAMLQKYIKVLNNEETEDKQFTITINYVK